MATVDLYWLPLGAGGHFVRLNGRLYEALAARLQRRRAYDLYHSALQVELPEGTFVIEQAPVHDWSGKDRGVVAEGAVGTQWAGRFKIFRYEIRLWPGGHIPDVAEAVDSPRPLTNDEPRARRVLDVVRQVPTPVWGRDELATGEMWNSNSVIAWTLARGGIDTDSIQPPAGGRAPGWQAGLVVARRRDRVAKELPTFAPARRRARELSALGGGVGRERQWGVDMARVEGETIINRPVEEVFDFVADERNEPRYNPRMLDAEQISDGPIGVGTRFRTELDTIGPTMPMVVEFTGFERPWRLGSVTRSSMMETEGALTFESVPGGTRMRWSWDVRPRGALKLMAPIVGVIGRRQEQRIWGNLKRLLESGGERP